MENYVFKEYESFVSNACLISSFSNLFYNCKLDISESDIFFLGDGMKMDYEWNDHAKSMKDIVVFHDSNILIQNFFERINETISIEALPDGEDVQSFKAFIKQKIDDGIPVIIAINTEFVTYYQTRPKKFRPHFLTVLGYQKDKVYVSDCLVPTVKNYETYVGFFGIDDLYKASKSRGFTYYDFNYQQSGNKIKAMDHALIHSKFKENIEIYLTESQSKLQDFVCRIKNMKNLFPPEEHVKSSEDLFFNIKYNGILHSRVLVYEHMRKYHNQNEELLSELKQIQIKWEGVNYALLKNNLTNAPQTKYDGLYESMLNLLDFEYQTYKSVLDD